MSVSELPTLGTGETYQEKFMRKFKQQPLVPLGAALTAVTLTVATVRMRQGKSTSMNHWLRARVIAQGLTIAAIVAGSFILGEQQEKKQEKTAREQDAMLERAAFEARMKAAVEAHRLETGQTSVSTPAAAPKTSEGGNGSGSDGGWWGWLGFSGNKAETKPAQTSEAATTTTASPSIASTPPAAASTAKVDSSKTKTS
ncbi:hypoxia induced protein conserved region-domain-containing protein [Sparassis latifolia]